MDLQERLNKQLSLVCFADDYKSMCHLIEAGANPMYNDGNPLLSAVLGGAYSVVGMLLCVPSYGYSNTSEQDCILKCYKTAKKRQILLKTDLATAVVTMLADHFKYCFNHDIEEYK